MSLMKENFSSTRAVCVFESVCVSAYVCVKYNLKSSNRVFQTAFYVFGFRYCRRRHAFTPTHEHQHTRTHVHKLTNTLTRPQTQRRPIGTTQSVDISIRRYRLSLSHNLWQRVVLVFSLLFISRTELVV